MNYMPLCLFCLLLPVSALANAAVAANKASTKPVSSASKTYDAKGKLLQKTDDKGRHYNAKGKFSGKTVTSPTGSKSYDTLCHCLKAGDSNARLD